MLVTRLLKNSNKLLGLATIALCRTKLGIRNIGATGPRMDFAESPRAARNSGAEQASRDRLPHVPSRRWILRPWVHSMYPVFFRWPRERGAARNAVLDVSNGM